MRAVNIGGDDDAVIDIDAQIIDTQAKISRAFSSYRAECVAIQGEIERWKLKYHALLDGNYRILRGMLRACAFAEKCQTLGDRFGSSAFICQDIEAVLAARMFRLDGAIIVLDLVGLPSDRMSGNGRHGPLDPLEYALDRALSGLVTLADVVIVTSAAHGAELRKLGVRTTVMPEYPSPRPFAVSPGIRQACHLAESDRLILFADRLEGGVGNRAVVAALQHLPENYHIAIVGHPSSRYRSELREYVDSQGLEGRVHLLPAVPFASFPSFAGSADVAVIGLDPPDPADRLAVPASLFDCISARLPVLTGNFPEIEKILRTYGVGAQFDRNEPQSIAASLADLAQAKPLLLPNIEKAARELVWSRNEAILLAHLHGARSVAMLRAERPASERRSCQIATTLLEHDVDLTIVTAYSKVETDNADTPRTQIVGARCIEIPIDI